MKEQTLNTKGLGMALVELHEKRAKERDERKKVITKIFNEMGNVYEE